MQKENRRVLSFNYESKNGYKEMSKIIKYNSIRWI